MDVRTLEYDKQLVSKENTYLLLIYMVKWYWMTKFGKEKQGKVR